MMRHPARRREAHASPGFPLLAVDRADPGRRRASSSRSSRGAGPSCTGWWPCCSPRATGRPHALGARRSSRPATPGFQFVVEHTGSTTLDITWHLGVDGISLFLVVLTGLLFPLAIVRAPSPTTTRRRYYAWLLVLEAAASGVFLSLDLFLFFVFFEIVARAACTSSSAAGATADRVYAATKFFLFTMFGSAFMLVSIVTLAVLHQRRRRAATSRFDLRQDRRAAGAIATTPAAGCSSAFAIAFAVKVPVFPLHTWLPDAHTEAPTAGSVILAGVMLKLGTYGFLRFGLYLFPEASVWFAPGAAHPRRDRHHLRRHRRHHADAT